jgi:hypothetical protein
VLTIVYCDKCKEKVLYCGDIAFHLFEFICEQFYQNEPLEISTNIHDDTHGYEVIVKLLEKKGLVVTTECSQDSIQVKPLGIYCFGGDYWKICRFCIHEENIWD